MVFSPVGSFLTEGGLYIPVHGWGDYSKAKQVYLLKGANDLVSEIKDFPVGTKMFVSDGFELVDSKDLWEHYCNEPAFKELKDLAAKFGGKIKTALVNELAILAVDAP